MDGQRGQGWVITAVGVGRETRPSAVVYQSLGPRKKKAGQPPRSPRNYSSQRALVGPTGLSQDAKVKWSCHTWLPDLSWRGREIPSYLFEGKPYVDTRKRSDPFLPAFPKRPVSIYLFARERSGKARVSRRLVAQDLKMQMSS